MSAPAESPFRRGPQPITGNLNLADLRIRNYRGGRVESRAAVPGVLVTEFAAPVAKTEPPFDLLFVSEDGRADRCTCGRRIHRTGANVADVWVAPVGVPSAAAAVIWIPLTFGLLTTGVN